MRTVFLTTLYAIAIGFSLPPAAWSQSALVAPVANVPNPRSDAMAKIKKSKIKMSAPVGTVKRDESWFREMRDPCQVEG